MLRAALLAFGIMITASCAHSASTPAGPPPGGRAHEVVDERGLSLFHDASVDGAFLVYDAQRDTTTIVHPQLASERFIPASTFKIANTLIGLETGVIPDEHFSLKWDGKKRSLNDWNCDHDLASAMKHSVVWFYQEIARRIGDARMREWLARLDYGNRDPSSGIDTFWLEDGSLRISPREQLDFVRRLQEGRLPVSKEHADVVKRITTIEERPGVVLRGKTGGSVQDGRALGWLVGLIERGSDRYAYVLFVLGPPVADAEEALKKLGPVRKPLARKLLVLEGALPPDMAEEPNR